MPARAGKARWNLFAGLFVWMKHKKLFKNETFVPRLAVGEDTDRGGPPLSVGTLTAAGHITVVFKNTVVRKKNDEFFYIQAGLAL